MPCSKPRSHHVESAIGLLTIPRSLRDVSNNQKNSVYSSYSRLRIFIKRGATYHLLGMPSCYEIGLHSCRWRYKTDQGWIVVNAWVSPEDAAAFLSIESDQTDTFVILSNLVLGNHKLDHPGHIDIDAQAATATLRPHDSTDMAQRYPDTVFYITTSAPAKVEHIGTDEKLFTDHQSRGLPYLTVQTKPVQAFSLAITASIVNADHAKILCTKYQTQPAHLKQDQQASWAFWQSGQHPASGEPW